jgi:tripartite ATP-independent transporter DctP family solute receptor
MMSAHQHGRTTAFVGVMAALLLVAAGCGNSSGSGSAGSGGGTYTMRISTGEDQSSPISQADKKFGDEIESMSHGKIKVQLYYYSTLGTLQGQFDQLRSDSIQAYSSQPGYLASYYAPIQVLSLPFEWTSRQQIYGAVDGAAGKFLRQQVTAKAGLRIAGYAEYGWEDILNDKHAVHAPADLKGLKIRPAPGAVASATLSALGAQPTSIDYTEAYTGLSQGVIDGAEVPLTPLVQAKIYEVAHNLSDTHEFFSLSMLMVNQKFYNSLPANLRQVVDKAAKDSITYERQQNTKAEQGDESLLAQHGVTITNLTNQEITAFQNAVSSVTGQQLSKLGPDAVKFRSLAGVGGSGS